MKVTATYKSGIETGNGISFTFALLLPLNLCLEIFFFFSQGADGKKVELQDVIVNFTKHSLHMQADDCVAKSDTLENGVACVTVCLYVFNLTVPLQSAM